MRAGLVYVLQNMRHHAPTKRLSIARALSFNGLGNAQAIAAINAGTHAAPARAGDTIFLLGGCYDGKMDGNKRVPFELAVKEAGVLSVMTSYNRLNGTWCAEDRELLTDVLRDEWGFEGFVVTDWYGVTTTEVSPAAGVDLLFVESACRDFLGAGAPPERLDELLG